jgi:hypothetical protein
LKARSSSVAPAFSLSFALEHRIGPVAEERLAPAPSPRRRAGPTNSLSKKLRLAPLAFSRLELSLGRLLLEKLNQQKRSTPRINTGEGIMSLTKSEIIPAAFWIALIALAMATSLGAPLNRHGLQASKTAKAPSFSASVRVQTPPATVAVEGGDVVMRLQ